MCSVFCAIPVFTTPLSRQVNGYAPFFCQFQADFLLTSGWVCSVFARKWLNHFFTHIHDYNEDYSSDLLELLPHNLKQKGIL